MQYNKSKIIGCGSFLPEKILHNNDLSLSLDTSDEWIKTRTGISTRHIIDDDQYTSNIAAESAKIAIKNANISVNDITTIIVATTTPDKTFPATAVYVQELLGIKNAASFDIQAVCAGFPFGLNIADSMIKSGASKNILLVCADSMSRILDWSDRSTSVLFGDGAGSVVITEANNDDTSYIVDSKIYSDGSFADILKTSGGVSTTKSAGFVSMNGKEVFKHAVKKMSDIMIELLEKNNLTIDDIDHIIPHQANIRIIDAIIDKLNISSDKVVKTVSKHANTSAASIPLALHDLEMNKKLKKGDTLLVSAIGAGLSWGGAIIKW